MVGREAPTLPKLVSDWNSARHTSTGWPQFLEAVHLDGVRGWNKQWIEFRFPVVAIAGENGPYPRSLDTGCDYAAGCSVAVAAIS